MNPPRATFSIAAAEARVDRFFVGLLWAHFAAALLLAFWYQTWAQAVLIGLPAALIFTLMAVLCPGRVVTRCVAGAALLVFSALFIQQAHGLTEMHFHVFCALAFLLAYRDWRPLVAGAATIAVHHVGFAVMQTVGLPVYIYTSDMVGPVALTLIHAAFVVFETGLLVGLAVQMRREWRQAEDLSRLTQRLADGTDGDNLMLQLDWDAASPLAATAASVDGLLERLRSRIDAAKSDARQIREQAACAARETLAAKQGEDLVRAAITEVSNHAEEQARQTAQASANIAATTDLAHTLAESARRQSNLTDAMASATKQLCEQTQHVAYASDEQAAAAEQARAAAEQAIQAVAASAEATRAAVAAVAENVAILGQRSDGVRDCAETVGAIAARTNLLALNAAIEAARAGEHGRGFAVVANEVRKLADQSARAARQIDGLIGAMTEEIEQVLRITQGVGSEDSELTRVMTMTQEVIVAGERTEQLAARIGTLAAQNQLAAEGIGAAGAGLSRQIAALYEEIAAHDAAAGRMAVQADKAQRTIEQIAAITDQNSAAARQVVTVVAGQSQSLRQLTVITDEVAASAEAVFLSLARFQTQATDEDTPQSLRLAA